MTPITYRNQTIERLEAELAESKAQVAKLTAQMRAVKGMNKTYQEQHAQSRENAQLLYTTLRRVAPDVLKSIEGALWQNTTEYDKLMSEGRRWQEKHQRLEAENKALREALQPFADAAKNLIAKIAKSRYGYSIEHYGLVESAQGKYLGVSEIYVKDLRRAVEALQAAQAKALEPGEA